MNDITRADKIEFGLKGRRSHMSKASEQKSLIGLKYCEPLVHAVLFLCGDCISRYTLQSIQNADVPFYFFFLFPYSTDSSTSP